MSTEQQFHPVSNFSWDVNRAERSRQVRWLVPLLDRPEGRAWFLERLECPCTRDEARTAEVFHLCFPLRDIFTADYYQCRGTPHLEDQFIAYYNHLFELREDLGINEAWRTAPGGQIRHPGAGGRAGWHDDFLRERIPEQELRKRARNVRRMLGTEADVLLLTDHHVVLVECKYRGKLSTEQSERHQMMGKTLARRLDKGFHFGLVIEDEQDSSYTQISAPYMRWSEIVTKLREF